MKELRHLRNGRQEKFLELTSKLRFYQLLRSDFDQQVRTRPSERLESIFGMQSES
jgi:hypothetical protein